MLGIRVEHEGALVFHGLCEIDIIKVDCRHQAMLILRLLL